MTTTTQKPLSSVRPEDVDTFAVIYRLCERDFLETMFNVRRNGMPDAAEIVAIAEGKARVYFRDDREAIERCVRRLVTG